MSNSLLISCVAQSVIKKKYGQDATNVGDEGGFAPNIQVCPLYLWLTPVQQIIL
jgi:enolase